jgi:hypothetical protein
LTEPINTAATPTALPALPLEAPSEAPKRRGWLPLLTVLFLISYGLMTMLIVEQGSTIESQRALIRELFRDSTELTATKLKAQRDHAAAAQRAQSPAANQEAPLTPEPSSQIPTTQIPSTQTPMTQSPSTQVQSDRSPSSQTTSQQSSSPQATQQNSSKKPMQKQFRMPSKPAPELTDDRRALVTI